MLELHITNTYLTDSNASIGWCVDRETLEMLATIGWKNPAILIITTAVEENSARKEYRKVVDLKDYVSYIEFRSAGPNNIFAYIVENKKAVIVKDMMIKKYNGEYFGKSIRDGGEEYVSIDILNRFNISNDNFAKLIATPLEVVVPSGVFAKPPAKWEKTWVSWLNTSKSIDQCEWRKKRLFAFSIQPIIFLLNFLLRFVMYFAAFMIGMKGVKYLSFLNPLRKDLLWAKDDLYDKHWLLKPINVYDTVKTFIKTLLFNIFVLVFATPLVLVLFGLMWKFHLIFGIMKTLGCILITLLLIIGSSFAVSIAITTIRERKEKSPAWYLEQDNADLLICSPDKKITSINDLPSNKKTIWLRFQDLKSKVCRPYSA